MPRNFIRAVIFDLGGTLMYERGSWHSITAHADEALTNYLREQGMEINLSTFPREFRRRLQKYFNQREKDMLETPYTFVLRDVLKDKGYERCTGRHHTQRIGSSVCDHTNQLDIGRRYTATLKKLEADGYRLGLISNAGDDKDVHQLARRMGISSFFDFIVTSAACSYRKPHPRIFELALSNWYFLPSEAVMVGDNLEADIRGAKNAGLYGIWISRRAGERTDDQMHIQPDASLTSLSELPALLDLLQVQ